ncbi:MAG: hypothetical protein KC486_10685 [Myxococcales bacterium]|nr:hypothetical protein [Myxococcales bacterium]
MNPDDVTFILIIIAAAVVSLLVVGLMLSRFYRKVDQGKALIINKMGSGEPIVTFKGGWVLPVVHRAEVMDISVKTIEIDRRGKEGLICADNIRADIKVTFFIRVNKTEEDVLKVAQSIGCSRASDERVLENIFIAKFSEALKTVGKRLEFEQLYTQREQFRDQIIEVIGRNLNGYFLDDAAIDFLEQTPIDRLDPNNILDAQGIRKITRITAEQNVSTNELRQKERMEIGSQNLAADEAVFRFEQQRAEAEARKAKEIAIAEAREQNEALRVSNEETKKTAVVQASNQAEVGKAEEDRMRMVAIAEKAREREIAVEHERVEKARSMEAIARERAVELQRIEKEKALEIERKAIADVVRERVAVDKTVAEEEERIKDLRVVAEAKRLKQSTVIGAEAEAEEGLIKEIKAAQAMEEVAKFEARKKLVVAEADLEAADKQAQAKVRLAEGVQAEAAAAGLAEVKVKEADAVASEKQGMARIRVEEAEAAAIEKRGMAENQVMRERFTVEAGGEEQKGLAVVKIREAEAAAIAKQGEAQASAVREKLAAEASGIAEKAKAMKELDGVSREHEEFRIRLEQEKDIQLAKIEAQRQMAQVQAEVLAKAFEGARFNIVGGDGSFFERFVGAVSTGAAIDATIDNSEALKTTLGDYLSGDKDLAADLKEVLTRPSVSSDDLQKLSVTALLAKMMIDAKGDERDKIRHLVETAKELGLG